MTKALIWKEWCEQRWKLAFGCVLIGGFTTVALRARIFPDEGVIIIAAVFGSALMALLVSMGLFASEREEGTLGTLLALPIKKWKVFAAKMAVGAFACAGPIVLAIALMLIMAGGRELSMRQTLLYGSSGMAAGLSTYVWMATFAIRQPSEAKAGLAAIASLAVWLVPALMSNRFGKGSPALWLLKNVTPFELMRGIDQGAIELLKSLPTQLLFLSGLLVWGAWQFGKEGRVER